MKRRNFAKWKAGFSIFLLYLLAINCSKDELPRPATGVEIKLRWVRAYEDESIANLEKGLMWSLSFLGASLPKGNFSKALQYKDSAHFNLNLEILGFKKEALDAFAVIIDELKASEEFERFGAIDAARFIVLTLHSSWHYYRIVNSPKTIREFLALYPETGRLAFPVLRSSIALKSRVIRFHVGSDPTDLSFLAEETEETQFFPDHEEYPVQHFETLDVMPNGQLRFAIYDSNGQLIPAAPARQTGAGKPSKCLWCHETNVQPLFVPTPEVEGFMSSDEYQSWIDSSNLIINEWRSGLKSDLSFEQQP